VQVRPNRSSDLSSEVRLIRRTHAVVLYALVVLAAAAVCAAAEPQADATVEKAAVEKAADRAAAERFAGLWAGHVVYRPGSAELELLVELAPGPDGGLAGTITHPGFDLQYKPLEEFRVDGRDLYFNYRHYSEVRGPDALYEFEAALSEDGRTLAGEFIETRGRIPFELHRIGDPGTPHPEREPRPLADLSDAGAELRQAFNEDRDQVRLILLLSPT
jgi:hypothetical protein